RLSVIERCLSSRPEADRADLAAICPCVASRNSATFPSPTGAARPASAASGVRRDRKQQPIAVVRKLRPARGAHGVLFATADRSIPKLRRAVGPTEVVRDEFP